MATDQAFSQAFDEAVQHAREGRLEDAADAWQRAADLAPERPGVHYNLGNALNKLSRADDAIKAYRRSVEIDPGLANAAQAYRGAIGADPNDAEAHMNLGNTLDLLGDGKAAEEALRRSSVLDPGSVMAQFNLANVLNKAGRSGEAEACYQRALDINPNLPQAHDCLGRIQLDQGDLAAAQGHYQRAIELDPGFAAAPWIWTLSWPVRMTFWVTFAWPRGKFQRRRPLSAVPSP